MRTARKFRRTPWLLNQGQEVYRRQEDGRGKTSIQCCWTLLKGWAVGLQSKFGPAAGHRPVHKTFGLHRVEIPTMDVPRLSLTHPSIRGGTKKGPGFY